MSFEVVVDTSALVAIHLREPEAEAFLDVFDLAEALYLPASCRVEFALLHRMGSGRHQWLEKVVKDWSIQTVPIDEAVAQVAIRAAGRFGRGSRHGAKLNFGDCLSYAVARHLDLPLLFKGGDFGRTDIKNAIETRA